MNCNLANLLRLTVGDAPDVLSDDENMSNVASDDGENMSDDASDVWGDNDLPTLAERNITAGAAWVSQLTLSLGVFCTKLYQDAYPELVCVYTLTPQEEIYQQFARVLERAVERFLTRRRVQDANPVPVPVRARNKNRIDVEYVDIPEGGYLQLVSWSTFGPSTAEMSDFQRLIWK